MKTTLLASLENQSTLAEGLEQHSVNTKHLSKHLLDPFHFKLSTNSILSCTKIPRREN